MTYEPWPVEGCTLAEARERTADRSLQRELRNHRDRYSALGRRRDWLEGDALEVANADAELRSRLQAEIQTIESKIDQGFRSLFQERRLIAYGRKNDLSANPCLMGSDIWPALTAVNWESSTAGENRLSGTVFLAVRVFPVLKAPRRLEQPSGKPLAEAFRKFVLQDPEVTALAKLAIEETPELERVFVGGNCYVRGCSEWPLHKGAEPAGVIRQDPQRRNGFGALSDPDPQSASDAADALTDRFSGFFDLLRHGELSGRGIRADNGKEETLLQSVWSHGDFWFDARKGDILQVNPDCEDPTRDFLLRRWLGIVLERPNGKDTATSEKRGFELRCSPGSKASNPQMPFSPDEIVAAGSFGPALDQLVLHHPTIETLRTRARMASQRDHCLLCEDAGLLTPCYGHDEPLLPIKFASREKHETTLAVEQVDEIHGDYGCNIPAEIDELYRAVNWRLYCLFESLRRQQVAVFAHTMDGSRVRLNHTIWLHDAYYILPRTSDIFEARPARMIKKWIGAAFVLPSAELTKHAIEISTAASDDISSDPADTKREASDHQESKRVKLSPVQASIDEAIKSIWPGGIPAALPVKSRNDRIIAWQKANKVAVAGDKSIYRFLRDS